MSNFTARPFLLYHQIFEHDARYVKAHLTFEHLMRMCDDKVVGTPERPLRTRPRPLDCQLKNWTVEQLPFAFDVIELLSRGREVEMVFSSLIETLPQGGCCVGVEMFI